MESLISFFVNNWQDALTAVLAILGGFSVLAKFTPTEADDKIIQTVLNFVHGLGLTKKK